jgi:hypothetical protein
MANAMAILAEMPPAAVVQVRVLEDAALKLPQLYLEPEHALHAGMYIRTIMVPAGVMITGALIKCPTVLIFNGDATVYTSNGLEQWTGYRVILAPAQRKQAFLAHEDTWLTAMFATKATTVEEAENEFTDEPDRLASRRGVS